jgi:hypothetical protein
MVIRRQRSVPECKVSHKDLGVKLLWFRLWAGYDISYLGKNFLPGSKTCEIPASGSQTLLLNVPGGVAQWPPQLLLGQKIVGSKPVMVLNQTSFCTLCTYYMVVNNIAILYRMYFFKGCPGWGANPGSFDFVYFLIPSLNRWATAAPRIVCATLEYDEKLWSMFKMVWVRIQTICFPWDRMKVRNIFYGHRVRLQNRRPRHRIPPGCNVLRILYIAVLLSLLNMHCHCA